LALGPDHFPDILDIDGAPRRGSFPLARLGA